MSTMKRAALLHVQSLSEYDCLAVFGLDLSLNLPRLPINMISGARKLDITAKSIAKAYIGLHGG